MKRNLILSIIACGASLVLSPGLYAQDGAPAASGTNATTGGHPWGGHHGGGGMSLERLTTELGLTADQQTQVKPILDTLHSQMQSIHQDTSLAPKDRMAKAKEARETANSQINALLQPDQQAKFAAMQAKMHGRHHEGGDAANPAPSASATP